MNQEKSTCNPLELWPTRSYKKLRVKKSSTKGGYHDGINGEVVVPIANDAYSRTVRMHEAGHSLFSKREIRCDDAVAQGIEDARVHTLINTQGTAARDELSVAIRDLHIPEAHTVNRALACIISLRSGAILFKDVKGSKAGSLRTASWLRAVKRLQRMAGVIGPKFYGSLREALELLEDGDQWQKAEELIRTAVKLANAEAEPKKAKPKVEPMPKPKAPAPKTDGEPMPAPPKLDGDEKPEPAPEPKEAEEGAGEGEASDGEAEPAEGEESSEDGKGSPSEDGEAEDGEAEDEDEDEDDDSFTHVELSSASDSLGDVPRSTFTKKTLVIDKTEIKKGVYATADLEELSKGITKEAAALLSESSKDTIDMMADTFPTLNIMPIFKSDPVRAQVGSSVHHSIAGARIDAKKLSLVITPGTHRIFNKKKRSNGGTIVIDASGSTRFDLKDLEAILLEAPVATIAFYNAYNDSCGSGNLWIFAYRGKRAKDLTGPGLPKADKAYTWYFERYGRWLMNEDKSVPEAKRWGVGNVVDFQVCEWLLAQPKPRYFVTDKEFVGSSRISNAVAFELTQRAEDAGLLQCVWSPDHKKSPKYTFELLREMLARNAGK